MKRIRIRCGQGLGDSLYLQAVVAELLTRSANHYEVCSDWPDVFMHLRPRSVTLKNGVSWIHEKHGLFDIAPFSRARIDVIAHYSGRKHIKGTSQFEDCFISAGLSPHIVPRTHRPVVNTIMLDDIRTRAAGRKVVMLQHLRPPMGRTDYGFGMELNPKQEFVESVVRFVREYYDDAFVIKFGSGESLDSIGFDYDLRNKTSVSDIMDIGSIADLFVSPCSFVVPLSELYDVPGIFPFGSGLRTSTHSFLRSITPEKVLLRHNRNGCRSLGIWDDDKRVDEKVHTWLGNL